MNEPPPVFVLGVNRSGTTLLSLMLDAHSRVAIPYESHFFVPYFKRRAELGDLRDEDDRLALVKRILDEPYVRRWDRRPAPEDVDLGRCTGLEGTIRQVYLAYARRHGKDVWGDKTPSYVTEIDVLNAMFPDARFVHIVRDGRDVALSVLRQAWGAGDFMTAVRHWADAVRCARKMLRMLPAGRWRELRFEDLVADPEPHVRRLTEFLGLDFEPGMLSNYTRKAAEKVGDVINKHHAHLSEKPSAAQAYKWRETLSPADQAVAHEIAGPLLDELGYAPGVTSHPLRLWRKVYHRLYESYSWRFRGKEAVRGGPLYTS